MGPAGLTAVFGMGTGVTPPVWSPENRPAGCQATPAAIPPTLGATHFLAPGKRGWHLRAVRCRAVDTGGLRLGWQVSPRELRRPPESRAPPLALGSWIGSVAAQAAVPNGVEEKTNEHKAALRLLEDLALEGRLVTGDATFCQHDFCRRVIDTRGAYLVFVKDNQPTLLSDITLNPISTSLTALSRCITCGRFFSIRFVERSESERL